MGDHHTQAQQQEQSEPARGEKHSPRAKTPASHYLPPRLSVTGNGSEGPPLTRDNLLLLQRTVGNHAVTRLLRKARKLGAPVEAEGRGATGVADPVVGVGPVILRKCACGADAGAQGECSGCRAGRQTLQREAEGADGPSSLPASVSTVMQSGGGEALPQSTREQMEGMLGADLRGVRTHTSAQAAHAAQDINAHAFTVGRDIYFGAGQYQPDTRQGQHLLAHELTHTVQQADGRGALQSDSLISHPDDALEREADEVASNVGRARPATASREQSSPTVARRASAPLVQRSWYDPFVGAAEWAGGKVASGAEATWEGAKWAGGKVASGAKIVANEGLRMGGAAVECFGSVSGAVSDLLFGSISVTDLIKGKTLQSVLGVPKPQGDDAPAIIDIILSVARHPCVQMIPGYTLMADAIEKLGGGRALLVGAWRVMENPGLILDAIRNELGGLIAQIPDKARELAEKAITFSDPPKNHLGGIWRHLEPKLLFLGDNWWEVLKQTGEDLLWPWPGVGKDLGEIWEHLKAGASDLWDLDLGGATDHFLAIWRLLNNVAGRLYGWFFIASVLIGAIIGGVPTAGAGALPGAAAGAAFALEVGEVMLISTVAAETISILKAGTDLVFTNQTEKEEEADYEQIATSGIVLAITGVMFLIGVIAARFAKAIIQRVAGRVWARPALRGRGTVSRGDIIEIRVATATRVTGLLRRRAVTWLESVRRNFPVIDLLEDGTINVTLRGGGRAPLYQVNGGRLISVKSTILTSANAQAAIQGWVDELANFTTVKNVTVVNPAGRTLMVATQTPLDDATLLAVRAYATGRGVTVEPFGNLPPNHPAVIFPDAIPSIAGEAGVVAGDNAADDTHQPPAGGGGDGGE